MIPLSANRCYAKIAVISSDIFGFSRYNKSVRKISSVGIKSKCTWENFLSMLNLSNFTVSSFMKSIYLIGGYLEDNNYFKGCYKSDINNNKST